MAKVKLKGIQELSQRLNANLRIQLNKLFRDDKIRKQIGEWIIEDIKNNVDFGSPAKSTLKWRKRYDPINDTDPAYRRGKLNATFTGELLQDLANNIRANPTDMSYTVEHSNKRHSKYQGVTKMIGSMTPYDEISSYLINDLGYDYFQLTPGARAKIVDLIRTEFFKLLANVG